ncbi:phosphoribosyltransferase family protein [Metabacillus fastidiosus]|uniref:Phosphoribosyltransferase family protein n=1 Tax=Metabacillus fastidiosus TaxID=1458 RepID=A0ABU6P545_9BACI|nr:phosphoribosyltransferase family protein [Metabacillus fastidiosus]
MNSNLSSNYLVENKKNTYSFNILNQIDVSVTVRENHYNIPLNRLFKMAARVNKKRSFLFVSKILGKHLPVSPAISLLAGSALAARYMEVMYEEVHPYKETIVDAVINDECTDEIFQLVQQSAFHLPKEALFIGFAETATALGHSMFNHFTNAKYMHTTREDITELSSVINFEEEHSHATAHRCYVSEDYFKNDYLVVLVDDEITTGKTTLNIIESIQKIFPRKEYVITSILDWRSEENIRQFKQLEEKLGITIHAISLMSGAMKAQGEPLLESVQDDTEENSIKTVTTENINIQSMETICGYLPYTGRFGLCSEEKEYFDQFITNTANKLMEKRSGKRTLCLGTGEFMYLPMRIAAQMGSGVYFQSTTRSPIHSSGEEGYAINNKFAYPSLEDSNVMNYFYNVPSGFYDEVFLFLERDMPSGSLLPLVEQLQKVFPKINIVRFQNEEGVCGENS